MEAIRQTVKVKNHSFNIKLPNDFNAEEVEVIIIAKEPKNHEIPQWQKDQVRERHENYLKNPLDVTTIEDFLKELDDEV